MKMTAEQARKQLCRLKPLMTGCSLSAARAGQSAVGELMAFSHRKEERLEKLAFPAFSCGIAVPEKDRNPEKAILYLHGGGYTAGGLTYAKGFASVLTAGTGCRTFFPAYRLAPENRYPAALKDCLTAYRYITGTVGIAPENLLLCGESAGGGLIYCLSVMLRKMKKPMPAGLLAISPWTDLTASGSSYETNRDADPSMTEDRLRFFAECYTDHPENPLVSPVLGDLSGMPESLIFSGGDEILLSDAVSLQEKLTAAGCGSRHIIRPGMWHVYPLYGLPENEEDMELLFGFIRDTLELTPER